MTLKQEVHNVIFPNRWTHNTKYAKSKIHNWWTNWG